MLVESYRCNLRPGKTVADAVEIVEDWADVIDDFDVTRDIVDFSHFSGISNRDDLTIDSFPTGTLLTGPDGDTLWLINVTSPDSIVMYFGNARQEYTGGDQESVAGTAGDDVFVNAEGTQYIFAHGGTDTLLVNASRFDYTIAKTLDNTGYVMWSNTEVDLMWDLERIEFVDETVELDPIEG